MLAHRSWMPARVPLGRDSSQSYAIPWYVPWMTAAEMPWRLTEITCVAFQYYNMSGTYRPGWTTEVQAAAGRYLLTELPGAADTGRAHSNSRLLPELPGF